MTRKIQLFFACLITLLTPGMAIAASPVVYVYVQQDSVLVPATNSYSGSPLSVFSATSAGKLTQIKGSPFTLLPAETMVGTNGTHVITVDNTPGNPYLRSYDVASDGVIGKEVSKIDLHTWSYYGGSAELSPNGKNVYVWATRGDYSLLNFSLSTSGDLAFQGIAANAYEPGLPTITGNNKFAFGFDNYCGDGGNGCDCGSPDQFVALTRESNGSLEGIAFSETDPIAQPGPPPGNFYFPEGAVTNDATNHLAVVLNVFNDGCQAPPYVNQLASYTVGSQGDLVSTNTWENMPTLPNGIYQGPMQLNPAGNILAVALGTGTQFYHFNGAEPITPFTSGIIGISGFITAMAWDKDNHLYALNGASGKLHVYTVTTTEVVEAAGSPYEVPYCGAVSSYPASNCPQTLIVRSAP
jgi:hypothetical protein